jgi:haloalkane dehalogenase
MFRKFRTSGEGEKLILEDPFPAPRSRLPTWRFPNGLPIAGEPAAVTATLEKAHAALAVSAYPKLLFAADPGALVSPAFAEEFAGKLTGLQADQARRGDALPAGGSSGSDRAGGRGLHRGG